MKGAIRAEMVKLTTIRLPFVLLAAGAVLTAGLALLTAADAGGSGAMAAKSLSTASGLTSVIGSSFLAMTMAMVFGVTVSTDEFRHQTATVTYLVTPSRTKVLVGKLVAGFCFGLLFGLLGAAVSTGIGVASSSAKGYHLSLASLTLVRYDLGTVLGAGLLAAIGVAVGALVKSQLAAVVGVLLWEFLVENTLGGLVHPIARFLPVEAATSLGGSIPPGGVSLNVAMATVLLVAVAGVLAAGAAATTLRRDVV